MANNNQSEPISQIHRIFDVLKFTLYPSQMESTDFLSKKQRKIYLKFPFTQYHTKMLNLCSGVLIIAMLLSLSFFSLFLLLLSLFSKSLSLSFFLSVSVCYFYCVFVIAPSLSCSWCVFLVVIVFASSSYSLKGPCQPLSCFCLHLGTRLTKLLKIITKRNSRSDCKMVSEPRKQSMALDGNGSLKTW